MGLARRWLGLGLARWLVGLGSRLGLGSWLGLGLWLGLGRRLGLGPGMGLDLALESLRLPRYKHKVPKQRGVKTNG